jgi:hypothetical protein
MSEVRLYLPENSTASHVITPDGFSHSVVIDSDGKRYVEVEREHAALMLAPGPWPHHNTELRDANSELYAQIGPPPAPAPGINIGHRLAQQRAAATPRSMTEITAETMAMHRRALG